MRKEKTLNFKIIICLLTFVIGLPNFIYAQDVEYELTSYPQNKTVSVQEEVYIPQALQNTPVYEIEVLSTSPSSLTKTTTSTETVSQKPKTVTVYKGHTLYSIANENGVKVYELADYNNIKSPFVVKLGQKIKIPTTKTVTNTTETEIITNLDDDKSFIVEPKKDFITVAKGDTIYSIAKKNNVPLKDLILRNNLKAPYTLSIGKKIYIPNTAFHIVKAKDTTYSISKKYNVSLNSLVKLNKLTAPYKLIIGQKILLPAPNIEIEKTEKKYIVKDAETTKFVKPSENSKEIEITSIKVAASEDIEEIEITSPPTEIEIAKQEKIKNTISKPSPLTSSRFLWPVKGKIISEYGIKENGKRNDGINISAKLGTNILAAENGIVAYAGNELKGLGNLVIIKHAKNYMTIYAHTDTINVKKAQSVKRGDTIGTVGKTGRVSTPQLHFEIRNKTKSIDPTDML